MVNAWATKESGRLLAQQGLHAAYTIQVKLVPLALELTEVTLDSSDGKGPALTSDRISVRPRIFALLSGKLVIDQIEIDEPTIRLVFKDGELQNLPLKLPASPTAKKKPFRAPFSVFAVTGAASTSGSTPRISSRATSTLTSRPTTRAPRARASRSRRGSARPSSAVRARSARAGPRTGAKTAYDDDALCALDARVRYEPHAILVAASAPRARPTSTSPPNSAPRAASRPTTSARSRST